MKEVRTHLSDEEYEFVKERPRSFMRTLVQDRMKAPEYSGPDARLLSMVVPLLQLKQEGVIDASEVRKMMGIAPWVPLSEIDGGQ